MSTTRRSPSTWWRATGRSRSPRWIRWRLASPATIGRSPGDVLRSLRCMLLQAPIFHGHALAAFLEMESAGRSAGVVAGAGRRSRRHSGRGRRSAKQRERRGTGGYSALAEDRSRAAQRRLAVGGRRQSSHLGADCGGMRREHDCHAPDRKDSMKSRAATARLACCLSCRLLLCSLCF